MEQQIVECQHPEACREAERIEELCEACKRDWAEWCGVALAA